MYTFAFVITFMLASPPVPEVVIVSAEQLAAHRIYVPVDTTRAQPLTKNMSPVDDHEVMFRPEVLGAALFLAEKLDQALPGTKLYLDRDSTNYHSMSVCIPYSRHGSNWKTGADQYMQVLHRILDDNQEYWKLVDTEDCTIAVPHDTHTPMFLGLFNKAIGTNYRTIVPTS
jgi:hypothetical protein